MSQLNYNLSPDQRRLINMYMLQYNQTNTHIEHLLDMLDEIRNNIQNVIQNRNIRGNRQTRHSNNHNINGFIRHLFDDRTNNDTIYYDYARPINPQIYTQRGGVGGGVRPGGGGGVGGGATGAQGAGHHHGGCERARGHHGAG